MLLIFDLDDTLIDTYNTTIPFMLRHALTLMVRNGLVVNNFEEALHDLWSKNELAVNGKEALRSFLIGQKAFTPELLVIGCDAYYDTTVFSGTIPLQPFAFETLSLLQRNHTLVLVTYGQELAQQHKIQSHPQLAHLFSEVLVTDTYNKKQIYQQLLAKYRFTSSSVVSIGDKYKTDLLPAIELGMKVVHVQFGRGKKDVDGKSLVPLSITSLKELPGIIEKFEVAVR